MRVLTAVALLLFVSASTPARAQDPHAGHAGHEAAATSTSSGAAALAPRDANLPPSEDQAKAALDKSPRHGEYAEVRLPGSGAPIRAWIVYPERKDKAGVVLLIHEIYGLSDWMRGVADQLAREGFIAVVPDLVSGRGPGGGGTESAASRDDVVKLVRGLTPEETTARLNAVRDWATRLPSANGKSATVGFCWGGGQSFAYAAAQPALNGAVVFYGSAPDPAQIAKVGAPVVGFYGGDDARISSTIPATEAEMKKNAKSYEPHVYDGAGHGFLRAQQDRNGANLKATSDAWPRTVAFLKERLK